MARFASVDEYIASFPPDVGLVLAEVRRTMLAAVPDAGEAIKYDMPTVILDGRSLVHFAGWKRHWSVYPAPTGDAEFERAFARYRANEGTARFPYDEPVPYALISRLVGILLAERG